MKSLLLLIVAMAVSYSSCPQSSTRPSEFGLYANGLMYSEPDMLILRRMVDSLNLRFKTCDLSRPFYSYPQARMFIIEFASKKNSLQQLKNDLNNEVDFYTVLKRYGAFARRMDTAQLCIRYKKTDTAKRYFYLEGNPSEGYDDGSVNIDTKWEGFENQPEPGKGNWIYYYTPKGEDEKEYSIEGRFFPDEFTQKRLPSKYAQLVQYVDCMVDTNASIFIMNKTGSYFRGTPPSVFDLIGYVNRRMGRSRTPIHSEYLFTSLNDQEVDFAANFLTSDAAFIRLLNIAAEECISKHTGSDEFEGLVARFLSKEKALRIKRGRIVYGQCSADQRPRFHAWRIARLAAETNSWNIFLRAHLDIMNDRFERMSDGSYAYEGRKTYLKELEELNLNVIDLIIGMSLFAENVPANHYQGTVWRLGWGMTESSDRKKFEARVLEMIKDPELDEFNRGLLYLLYVSYIRRVSDEKEKAALINALKDGKHTFPASIQFAIAELTMKND
ncbi:MAG: hypothetical protein WCF67_18440 [Chitinophagaceae bacterium]